MLILREEESPSNAGIVLMAELDKKLKITSRFAECFQDYRDSSYVNYSVCQLLAQVEIFLADYNKPPRQIVLDMDVTDDQVHGNQEGAFFNPYYKGVCYAPLYIFCGHHLLVAKLRSSNVDPAAGALEELQRINSLGVVREELLVKLVMEVKG